MFVIDEPPPTLPLSQFPAIAFSPLGTDAAIVPVCAGVIVAAVVSMPASGAESKGTAGTDEAGGSAAKLLKVAQGRRAPGAHHPTGEDSRGLWQINIDPKAKRRTSAGRHIRNWRSGSGEARGTKL